MAFDFLLDEYGDIAFDVESGDITLVATEAESLQQRLGIRLRTNQGEWLFDQSYGVPYTNEIIGQKIRKPEVDLLMQAEALNEDGVDSILNYQSEFGLTTREYSASFEVEAPTGIISIFLPTQPVQDYSYPEPDPTNIDIQPCPANELIPLVNSLYKLINFDMAFDGDSTWYDVTGFFEESASLYTVVNFGISEGGTIPWS